MPNDFAELERLIEDIRLDLPKLKAKARKLESMGDDAALPTRAEIRLFESILDSHKRAGAKKLLHSDLHALLEAMHHGIQHCAQSAIDTNNDTKLHWCLGALLEIDSRMRKLRDAA